MIQARSALRLVILVFGVCLPGWDVYVILFLSWSESRIAGVFNVLTMAPCTRMRYASTNIRWGVMSFSILRFGIFTGFMAYE